MTPELSPEMAKPAIPVEPPQRRVVTDFPVFPTKTPLPEPVRTSPEPVPVKR